MDFTARLGDNETEAHINYECPCGCTAGLMYDRESGPLHLGQCCCGRLLWVGPQATAVVRSHFDTLLTYSVEIGRVTLPWGEQAVAALAVPTGLAGQDDDEDTHGDGHGHEHSH